LIEVVVVGGKMNMIFFLKIRKKVLVRLLEGKKGRTRMWGLKRE
jgi:hypothetical protein